jgi:regulator of Ty1 transposition protein 103
VVNIWAEEFGRVTSERKVAFLYLANHILQESRKKGRDFMEEFYRALPKCLVVGMRSSDERVHTAARRLVTIWDERKIFGSNHMKALKDAVAKAAPTSASKADHAPAQAPSAAPGGVPDEVKRRLQAVGSLGDVMFEVSNTAAKSSEWSTKCLQLKQVRTPHTL